MYLDKLGIWVPLDSAIDGKGMSSSADTAHFAREVERLGYSALWMPEAVGRNALVHASWLLANTSKLVVATGIANIYARDPMAMAAAQWGLDEQSDGRFLLGIGVSHGRFVKDLRGHDYAKPLGAMRTYLDGMKSAPYLACKADDQPPTVVAALREKMIALAAEHAAGAHTLNVTPDHTARARAILGPDKLLCVEQKVVLETDPVKARAIARGTLELYLTLENYRRLWSTLGFFDADMAGGGSDRLIDSLIAWGDEDALRARIKDHLDAGATHVCFNPVSATNGVDMRALELLAPGTW